MPRHPFDEENDEPYDPFAPFVIDWPSAKVLDSKPRGSHGTDTPGSVREIVLHLVEETAAHSGHLEIARELLDGRTRLGLR